ncbi:Aste57867_11185 [Aphanomyces stellatus]|uniref:Aste57867_11185 protein n=1 Tax=Aphanomyces stellatus TaxID=120398 RepID=A0A485KSY5_9STRA|nr:hypothetical protein As57867_011143 [Aphanomyces stellatus]VFT88052.1 Aste57867_11185 [Aphanomyces stellatus]
MQRRRIHSTTSVAAAAIAAGPKKKQLTPKPNVLPLKKKTTGKTRSVAMEEQVVGRSETRRSMVDATLECKPSSSSASKKKKATKAAESASITPAAWSLPESETKPRVQPTATTALRYKQPSWHGESLVLAGTMHDRLHQEIVEYARYTKSIVAEMAVHIEKTIDLVRGCVRKLWPEATVETYGSYSTGIWLPSSDIDLVVLGTSEDTTAHLKSLAAVLRREKWVESIMLVETAKVPLLKLVSLDSSVPIDITFETANTHSGLMARDLIKSLVDELPELYPLAIVFKQLLRERGLNDAYTGGLSSYSIVLMIIHFAQLWRAGSHAFNAALIYASGSLPTEAITIDAKDGTKPKESAASSPKKTVLKEPLPTAPVLDKPKPQPKSYAAVLEPTKNCVMSYAAVAVGATPITYASVAAKEAAPPSPRASSSSSSHGTKDDLEAVSESSSQADTEDTSADECSDDEHTTRTVCLGAHTVQLLEFFGCVFNYRKSGLSIRNGGFIYRLREMMDVPPLPILQLKLVIEDPIHPDRNVSAASFAFQKVVALFEDSYYALEYFRPTRFTPSPLSCLLSCAGHRGVHRRYPVETTERNDLT